MGLDVDPCPDVYRALCSLRKAERIVNAAAGG